MAGEFIVNFNDNYLIFLDLTTEMGEALNQRTMGRAEGKEEDRVWLEQFEAELKAVCLRRLSA